MTLLWWKCVYCHLRLHKMHHNSKRVFFLFLPFSICILEQCADGKSFQICRNQLSLFLFLSLRFFFICMKTARTSRICLFKANLDLLPQKWIHSCQCWKTQVFPFSYWLHCVCVYSLSIDEPYSLIISLPLPIIFSTISPWWYVATTDFKLVYLSHRFNFASFLLFIVQLFKLYSSSFKRHNIHQFLSSSSSSSMILFFLSVSPCDSS